MHVAPAGRREPRDEEGLIHRSGFVAYVIGAGWNGGQTGPKAERNSALLLVGGLPSVRGAGQDGFTWDITGLWNGARSSRWVVIALVRLEQRGCDAAITPQQDRTP